MTDKIVTIDPFTNIPFLDLPTAPTPETNQGGMFLSSVRELNVGDGGDNVYRVDRQGQWLGAALFQNAPFRVSMNGSVTATDLTITGGTIKYGKTSFTDSTHAGYFFSALGLYFGAAGDTTRLKYTLADGSLDFVGAHSGGSVGGIAVSQVGYVATDIADIVPLGLAVGTTGISIGNDGGTSANITLSWTAVSSNTFDHYVIRYKKTAYTGYTYVTATTNAIVLEGLTPNSEYKIGIASVNKYGTQSAFSTDITQTTAMDTTPPATVAGASGAGGIQYNVIEWTKNSDTDLSFYNVYRSTTNNSATATLVGSTKTTYFVDGNRVGGTPYYYWIKAVDTSGNESVAFSTGTSATPRNVETTDIVSIAANKVLIDGVVYLSNWQKSGDLTKIDGGSISANTITTTQLNFTPVQTGNVVASINASLEGIQISGAMIAISGSTTFSAGYDPTSKVASLAGTYASAASGARVLMFPSANIGLQVIDDGGADVFKTIIGGTDVGDVYIGNFGGGQGIKYDKSANTTTFAGNLSAASGTLGTVTAGTFQGCLFQTASTGERVEIRSDTTRINLINSSGHAVAVMNYGSATTAALLKLAPTDDARRGLEFIVGSTLGAGAKCITIDNPSTSISIDITDGGSTAMNIAGCSASAINISHAGTAGAIVVGSSADYPMVDIEQNGTASSSYGLRITQDTGALKDSIFVDCNADYNNVAGIYIDRDANSSSKSFGLKIDSANAGGGGNGGIDFYNGGTAMAIFNVPTDNTDPTGGGGAATGRIPIWVNGILKYLPYY